MVVPLTQLRLKMSNLPATQNNQVVDLAPDIIPVFKWDELIQQAEKTGVVNYGGGSSLIAGAFQSPNFKSGSAGWRLDSNGDLEANDGVFRGALSASTIDIGGSDATSFHVDIDGNMWLGDASFASAPAKISNAGAATFSNVTVTGGSITGTPIASIPNNSSTDISLLEATHDLVFSVTDKDTVAWALGTITLSNGRTFSISASNTGNMAARTYIYLDTGVSSTALQTTTTVSTAMGANKKLIAVAQNGSAQAQFTVYGGIGGVKLPATATSISNNNWNYSGTWSVTDADTVAWGAGTLTTSDGGSYSISGSNTGNMAAKTYIYFDLGTSSTAFQTTTTASSAIGDGKILIAIAQNGTGEANFIVVNDKQLNIDAANIVAGSITANEIAAGAVTATKIDVSQLSAISADMGSITAGTIVLPSGGFIRSGQTAFNTGTGFYIGNDSSTPKFSIGNPSTFFMTWDGTSLATNFTKPVTIIYTASGTWTKPTGLRYINVEVVGGGGGGGGTTTNQESSGGGGAGGYSRKYIPVGSLGATETVTIGASGGGGSSGGGTGSTGGTSSFGAHCSATGGVGGTQNSSGGDGGSGSGGDLNTSGGGGGGGLNTNAVSGIGGTSFFGGGGKGLSSSGNGQNADAYGAGGGGAKSSGSAQSGGDGKAGAIIVTEFYI